MNIKNFNFRERNIDRFIEIMAVYKGVISAPKMCIVDMPTIYESVLRRFGLSNNPSTAIGIEFYIKFPPMFKPMFDIDRWESYEAVIARVEKDVAFADSQGVPCILDSDDSVTLIETATQKLTLSVDQVFNCLQVASVIALMDGSSEIKAQHTAEALMYCHLYEND